MKDEQTNAVLRRIGMIGFAAGIALTALAVSGCERLRSEELAGVVSGLSIEDRGQSSDYHKSDLRSGRAPNHNETFLTSAAL